MTWTLGRKLETPAALGILRSWRNAGGLLLRHSLPLRFVSTCSRSLSARARTAPRGTASQEPLPEAQTLTGPVRAGMHVRRRGIRRYPSPGPFA